MSMDNLIPPRSSRKKLKQFDENIAKLVEEKQYQEDIERQDRKAENEYKFEKVNNMLQESYEARLYNDQKNRVKKDIAMNEAIDSTVPVLFASLVYRSLPLDEDYKKENVKYIYDESVKVFKSLVSAGAIDLNSKEPSSFKEMCEEIAVAFSDCKDTDEIGVPEVIRKALYADPNNTSDIIQAVNDKVINAVATEKKVIALKEKNLKENKYFNDEKTLFRHLNENNIHEVLKENSKLSKQDVMDLALCETLLDYTLLEMLHTCKLIDFDLSKINKTKRFINTSNK